MRPQRILFPILFLVSVLAGPVAQARYIRIIPNLELTVNDQAREVRAKWKIVNEGDEAAKEVSIEFPGLNESHRISAMLPAGGTETFTQTFPFQKLGIDAQGSYISSYRVIYHDLNGYPFSAVHLLNVGVGTAPAQALSFSLAELPPLYRIERERTIAAKVRNISGREIQLQGVTPIQPNEVELSLLGLATPMTLGVGQEVPVQVKMERKGGLDGSVFHVSLAFAGQNGDRHFAEAASFQAELAPISGSKVPAAGLALAGGALIAAVVFWFGLRGRKAPGRLVVS